MQAVFLICAVGGGTVFVIQFVMALVGFGAEDLDVADIPDDIDLDVADMQGDVHGHGSTWMFGVISFRTVVAALTFFGLAGLGTLEAGQPPVVALMAGIIAGLVAMYSVHFLMQILHRLRHDGTVRIQRSIGQRATVYIPIPAGRSGTGKVQLKLQDRLVEYPAVTSETEKLATGSIVEVVDVIGPRTLEVKALKQTVDA